MKFDPPFLTRGPLSGLIYVVTHGKILGHDDEGKPLIEASVKYDVTDQFDVLCQADEPPDREPSPEGRRPWIDEECSEREWMNAYPYRDGAVVVIGPQCFASEDGSVLSWRGENYYPRGLS